MPSVASLPMFPLGTVLLPGEILPLQVFEPRYRSMMADCLDGDGRFGVVLIERGSEVGGGDQRMDVGTIATIERYERYDDGRFGVLAVGGERLRVAEWLTDAPYPRAEIQFWPDESFDPADTPLLDRATVAVADSLHPSEAMPALVDIPSLASHQLVARAPIGPYDRHLLLAEPGPAARLRRLLTVLAELPGSPG